MASRHPLKTIRMQLSAGAANPAKVGQALGPLGVNLMEFVRAYNAQTEMQRGTIIPADITVYEDRSFSFRVRTPPTSVLLAQMAGIEKGSAHPNGAAAGWIDRGQLREIARQKLPDLNAIDLDGAERVVAGTARSMGIGVRD